MKWQPLLFALLILFICSSCSEDDEAPSFDRNLLINKTWVLTHLVSQQNGQNEENLYAQLEDCQYDDELIFFENGKYEMNPGEESCDLEVLETGTWELYGKQLFLANTEVALVELSETTLKIRHEQGQGTGRVTTTADYKVK